jgi:hypothetical protein
LGANGFPDPDSHLFGDVRKKVIWMASARKRMQREKKTVKAMVRIYCRGSHRQGKGLCDQCSELLTYSLRRLDKCPLKEHKPTCAKCPIHCYEPNSRLRMRQVMRYSGPRMLLHHPVLAILHMFDSRRSDSIRSEELSKSGKRSNN